jgi:hypothetical protein
MTTMIGYSLKVNGRWQHKNTHGEGYIFALPNLEELIKARNYETIFSQDAFNFIDTSISIPRIVSSKLSFLSTFDVFLQNKDDRGARQFTDYSENYNAHIIDLSRQYNLGTTRELEQERIAFNKRCSELYEKIHGRLLGNKENYSISQIKLNKKERKILKLYEESCSRFMNALDTVSTLQKMNLLAKSGNEDLFKSYDGSYRWLDDQPFYKEIYQLVKTISGSMPDRGLNIGADIDLLASAIYFAGTYKKRAVILTGDNHLARLIYSLRTHLREKEQTLKKGEYLNVAVVSNFYHLGEKGISFEEKRISI